MNASNIANGQFCVKSKPDSKYLRTERDMAMAYLSILYAISCLLFLVLRIRVLGIEFTNFKLNRQVQHDRQPSRAYVSLLIELYLGSKLSLILEFGLCANTYSRWATAKYLLTLVFSTSRCYLYPSSPNLNLKDAAAMVARPRCQIHSWAQIFGLQGAVILNLDLRLNLKFHR